MRETPPRLIVDDAQFRIPDQSPVWTLVTCAYEPLHENATHRVWKRVRDVEGCLPPGDGRFTKPN